MLRINQARAFPRAFVVVLAGLLSAGGCSEALAKARSKKAAPERAVEITPAAMTAPVRFFTINQVLARHDGKAGAGPRSIELASAGIASDAGAKVQSDMAVSVQLPPTSDEPFGLFTFRAPEGLLWAKWRGVEARMGAETKSIEDCKSGMSSCPTGAREFIALAEAASVSDPRTRAETVNRDINQAVRYVGDYQQHGVADLWSSPLETLAAGTGDCEDYAIAKFALLRAAGVAEADLKLLLVRDTAVRQDHAVLGVRIDGRWLVLDNRFSRLTETRDLPHFMPLFAIDRQGVSLFAAPYAERPHHESESDMLPAADMAGFGGGQSLPLML